MGFRQRVSSGRAHRKSVFDNGSLMNANPLKPSARSLMRNQFDGQISGFGIANREDFFEEISKLQSMFKQCKKELMSQEKTRKVKQEEIMDRILQKLRVQVKDKMKLFTSKFERNKKERQKLDRDLREQQLSQRSKSEQTDRLYGWLKVSSEFKCLKIVLQQKLITLVSEVSS